MNGFKDKIRAAIKPYGYAAEMVSITRLPEAQAAVARLVQQGLVDGQLSAGWRFYLKSNDAMPEAQSIVILAMPQPFTRLSFTRRGRLYPADIPPTYFTGADDARAEHILQSVLGAGGYRIAKAHLALKTLAAGSGLAEYGRNNITYVPGMGSLFQLVAFYTDAPPGEDRWQTPRLMAACAACTRCRDNCPAGSLAGDRFLVRAEKCLGFLNQTSPDTPYWAGLQPDWPNALIGCLRCQSVCPVNQPYLGNSVAGAGFSEEETSLILDKAPWEQLAFETRRKLDELRGIYPLMAANLRVLIEKQDKTAS